MTDVIAAPPQPRIPVGSGDDASFPVRRIHCVGRNFADHAREMGASAPDSKAARGNALYFCMPADGRGSYGELHYARGPAALHQDLGLVVARGVDAPPGVLDPADAGTLVYGYGVGLDLTRRDLQAAAKAKGLPWDTGKAFDASAPVSRLVPAGECGDISTRSLTLHVNGEVRQHGKLVDLIWDVPDILH